LAEVIERTGSISLLTDGERRYGNLLFEICHEVIRTGQPGRPKKRLAKGVRVRIKNKGAQKRPGRKRRKYQAPVPEHPETDHEIPEKAIHANHLEAFNTSMRRRNSTFRRRTNTYAKSRKNLQRTLDVYWLVPQGMTARMKPRQDAGFWDDSAEKNRVDPKIHPIAVNYVASILSS
jgi:hypothetical protein